MNDKSERSKSISVIMLGATGAVGGEAFAKNIFQKKEGIEKLTWDDFKELIV